MEAACGSTERAKYSSWLVSPAGLPQTGGELQDLAEGLAGKVAGQGTQLRHGIEPSGGGQRDSSVPNVPASSLVSSYAYRPEP